MSFIESLLQTARDELKFWTDGKLTECVKDVPVSKQKGAQRVRHYWVEGLGIHDREGCDGVAWSAAFICFCLRKTGMSLTEFPFNEGHHTYIRWAINNTKAGKLGKTYYGRRIAEYRPKPGDMVAQWRKRKKTDPDPNITFDHQPDDFYPSHCDIVAEVTASKIVTIGGNLSQMVRTTDFAVKNGLLVPEKRMICVLECRRE